MYTVTPHTRFILASASPRRIELLRGLGLHFEVYPSGVDEDVLTDESPDALVQRLAERKAEAVAKRFPGAWVLGADTTVWCQSSILNKPLDREEAEAMLAAIQGRCHEVWGGFCLQNDTTRVTEVHCSKVYIAPLPLETIRAYIRSGEPLDKAGSYAVQGVGAGFVQAVEGSYTNVVGLNLCAAREALLRMKVIQSNRMA